MRNLVLLMGHCHTGSRFLTKLLHAAGMELGNEECGWVGCTPGQEHPLLSQIGNTLYREIAGIVPHTPKEDRLALLRTVLNDYRRQADLNNWNVFGVKNNFFIDPKVWDIISPILFEIWNDVKIIITIRHPVDVHKTIGISDWTLDTTITSFTRTFELTKNLVGGGKAKLIVYPDTFLNTNNIKELVEWTGLEWKPEFGYLFDEKEVTNRVTKEEKIEFARLYPDAAWEYKELCSLASEKKEALNEDFVDIKSPKKKVLAKGRKKSGNK